MRKPVLFVFLSALCFSLGGMLFKLITWDAMAISSARSILAVLFISVFLLIRKHHFHINLNVVITAASLSCTNILYALANKMTTAGNTIVLQFSMPVFVILIMAVFYHKKPTKLESITCVLVFAGIVIFFIDSLSAGNMLGNAAALLSGIAYACFFIFNSRPESEPFTALILSYCFTILLGLPSLIRTDMAATPAGVWIALLALGFVQQGLGHTFCAIGIKGTSPVTAGLISGIEPILNPLLVAIVCHEMLTPLALVGAAIVLSSIIYYNYRTAKADAASA